jgi:hypothetical protein
MNPSKPLLPELRVVERTDTTRYPTIIVHHEVWLHETLIQSWHGPNGFANARQACALIAETIARRGVNSVMAPQSTCSGVQLPLL